MQKVFTVTEIMEVIPHRNPFLLIDKIVDVSLDCLEITAEKAVTINEPFFAGHFPGKPVMPGVLQMEAIAQAAAFLVLKFDETARQYKGLALTGLDGVKYKKPVVPGDTLTLKAKIMKRKGPYYAFTGSALVNNEIACKGAFSAIFLEKK